MLRREWVVFRFNLHEYLTYSVAVVRWIPNRVGLLGRRPSLGRLEQVLGLFG